MKVHYHGRPIGGNTLPNSLLGCLYPLCPQPLSAPLWSGMNSDAPALTSGELLYRWNGLQSVDLIQSDSNLSEQLRSFLNVQNEDQSERRKKALANVRSARSIVKRAHESVVSHIENLSTYVVPSVKGCIQSAIEHDTSLARAALHENLRRFDAHALTSALQYYSVLSNEMKHAVEDLSEERKNKEALKRQAKVARDLMLFNCHLMLESQGKIELSLLPHESAPFQRCVRAVHDNLHSRTIGSPKDSSASPRNHQSKIMRLTAADVRIVNVFKLRNDILAQSLQAHTNKINGAVLKGLFCCIPTEAAYGFAVHGIARQQLPVSTAPSSGDAVNPLSPCWLFAHGDPLRPLPSDLQEVHSIAGAASKLVNRPTAERPTVRFSRFSTLSTLEIYNDRQLEKGVLLALCRVLIVKQKTVDGPIINAHIVEAAAKGYDAVMSSLTEEYVLLNPHFVVPEFLIQTFFPKLLDCNDSRSQSQPRPDVRDCIPTMLISPAGSTVPSDVNSTPTRMRSSHIQWQTELTGQLGVPQEGTCSTAQVLQGNWVRADTKESDSMEDFDTQKNVMIKQSTLLSIEQSVLEFRSVRQLLLKNLVERIAAKQK